MLGSPNSARTCLVLVLLAAGYLLPQPTSAATENCPVVGQVTQRGSGWTTTRTPAMPEHYYGQTYLSGPRLMAIDPYDDDAIFVANNSVIARSQDGGCHWEEVWFIPDVPTSQFPFARGGYAAITSLELGRDSGGGRRVYAALWTSSPVRVHVIRSDDDGETWKLLGELSIWTGTYPRLRVSETNSNIIYLSFRLHATGATVYYRSRNGGDSWSLRSTRAGGPYPAFGSDFLVDPVAPARLWEWDLDPDQTEPIRQSQDGGRTWRRDRKSVV